MTWIYSTKNTVDFNLKTAGREENKLLVDSSGLS